MNATTVEPRSYVIGLPVVITVHADGRVTAEVDLSEADDLWDTSTPDGQDTSEGTVAADVSTIRAAVMHGKVEVS